MKCIYLNVDMKFNLFLATKAMIELQKHTEIWKRRYKRHSFTAKKKDC
jgi:hypothetical protein